VDALSDVLNTIHFKSTVYCHADLTAPWGLKLGSHPGHVGFMMLMRGGCLLELEGTPGYISMAAGDLVISPMGAAYSIKDAEVSPVVDLMCVLTPEAAAKKKISIGGGGTLTNMILGCFEFQTSTQNPLLNSLPDILHVKAEDLQSEPWLDMTFRFLGAETLNEREGASVVISRLADLLFIQGVRAHISMLKDCPQSTGWLKALADPQIGRALSLIHANPEIPWTVASLATAVSMSRSSFAARFTQLMQTSPLDYVTSWRMQKAEDLLREGAINPSQIASLIGYQSEAAFRKAFKRETGQTPGAIRKTLSA
jgi:AraC-like DNA-binding protein